MKKRIFAILTVCFVVMSLSLSAFAHSGRTDSSGGHKDNKNKNQSRILFHGTPLIGCNCHCLS